jgi:hypothetical protein
MGRIDREGRAMGIEQLGEEQPECLDAGGAMDLQHGVQLQLAQQHALALIDRGIGEAREHRREQLRRLPMADCRFPIFHD